MQYLHMSLMDAYLVTRARRLNGSFTFTTCQLGQISDDVVLIQPNLRFFHELFGWEVELARREEDERQRIAEHMRQEGVTAGPDGDVGSPGGPKKREILYSWPSFCRDLVSFHFAQIDRQLI
jgi:dual specificity MAP kinase phosphatase